jgi:hypothetical protein
VKLLCFQARRFAWQGHSKTLDDAEDEPPAGAAEEAVVVFFHAERKDEPAEERARALRTTLKHVKWLANKRGMRNVVLHSFTHLGGENAAPELARGFAAELSERLASTGYAVQSTPFGWFCAWELAVHGESLAKVWKEV